MIRIIRAKLFTSILFGGLWLLSLLPMWLLYGISSFLAWVLREVIGYRKEVILQNLSSCFPDADTETIDKWARAYYVHLTDLVVEMLKTISLRGAALDKRMRIINEGEAAEFVKEKKGGIILASHYGNFEWVSLRFIRWLSTHEIPTSAIYARISNKVFEDVMLRIRGRWKTNLIPKKRAILESVRMLRQGHMIGFMSDQSPRANTPVYMIDFLGRPTRWLPGVAKLGLRAKGPVLYADVTRVGRGKYEIEIKRIVSGEETIEDREEAAESLMRDYVSNLENGIRRDPPFWLWSHKRWKWMT